MKALRIKSGSSVVRVFQSRSGKYTRFELRWTDHHGRKRRVKHSQRAVALAEARRIVADLARGHHHSELTLADLASFRAGINNLFGTGKTLETATAEFADLQRQFALKRPGKPVPTLKELADTWFKHHPDDSAELDVATTIEKFMAWKTKIGMSERHGETLKFLLSQFARQHPGKINDVTVEDVDNWRLQRAELSARSKNNLLSAVQSLFNLPALEHHPYRQAIRRLEPIEETKPTVKLWRPAEFQKLLETAQLPFQFFNRRTKRHETKSHEHLIPVLVLGGFCKLRSAEIQRVQWENIRLQDSQLLLEAGQTKNRRLRIVPIPANAVRWLRLYEQKTGKVWHTEDTAFHRELRALALRCGVAWRKNALRKSANTYSMLIDPNLERVSSEAGNSPAVLERNYLKFQGITRKDARAWFAIVPPKNTRKIVPMTVETPEISVPKSSPQ